MISVSNVSYSYQGSHRKVFDKFSLSFSEDGIYGLLGRNGTGKSTLLYLMSGLLRPSSGSVSVDGFNAFQRSPEMLSDIFLVPDTVYFPDCTLRSYISSNGCFYPRFSEEPAQEMPFIFRNGYRCQVVGSFFRPEEEGSRQLCHSHRRSLAFYGRAGQWP